MALQFTPNRQSSGNLQFSTNAAGRLTVLQSINWSSVQDIPIFLTNLGSLSTDGIVVRSSNGALTRSIAGTANETTVTNGNGVSGNPTISLPSTLTFTGKTVNGGTFSGPTINVRDNLLTIQDNSDPTKGFQVELSGITTATTRTWTVPDANSTFVGTDTTQTLSNKTLASPVVTTKITVPAGSTSAPGIEFDSGNGFYSPGTDKIGVTTAGASTPRQLWLDNGRVGWNVAEGSMTQSYTMGPTDGAADTRLTIASSGGSTRAVVTLTNDVNHVSIAMGDSGVGTLGERFGIALSTSGIYGIIMEHGQASGASARDGHIGILVAATAALNPLTVGESEAPTVSGAMVGVYKAGACYQILRNTSADIETIIGDAGAGAIVGTGSNHALNVRTNNTDWTTVSATGDWNFGTSGTSKGLSGVASVGFPATQIASADANTLDDYEEGTWTPTDASGAALSFAAAVGTYLKVGNHVIASASVTYPVTADGSAAKIGSMPFTVATGSANRQGTLTYKQVAGAQRILPDAAATTFSIYGDTGSATANSTLSNTSIWTQCIYKV